MDVRQHVVQGRQPWVAGRGNPVDAGALSVDRRAELVDGRAQLVEQWWAGLPRYDRHLARAFARTQQVLPQELYDQLVRANVVAGPSRHGSRPPMPSDVRNYVLSHAA